MGHKPDDYYEKVKMTGEMNRYQKIARATLRKDRRINIRVSAKDLEEIQKRALEEGIPYQTLISSILHKYASGRLARMAS
jgi:predicted DNA binding CopG/RHH family protein